MSASEMLDERAERAVAGTLLLDPSLVPMLRSIVRAEDFSAANTGSCGLRASPCSTAASRSTW